MVQQRGDTGEGWRARGSSTHDGEIAGVENQKAVVAGGSSECDVGNIARFFRRLRVNVTAAGLERAILGG